jgi:hypothetical protein
MDKFFELYGSGDNAAMAFGIFLVFLGLFAPKKFFGIEFDWKPATSAVALIAGVAFFAFSYPQIRFWQSNTVNVDRSILAALLSDTQAGADAIASARSGGDIRWCTDRSGAGLAPLNAAVARLKRLGAATK